MSKPEVLGEEVVFPLSESAAPGIIKVAKRTIRETDGSIREQYLWLRGDFVVVVPLDEYGCLHLKWEFKYGRMQEFLTFPSGVIRVSESLIDAAARELREELGMETESFELITPQPLVNSPDKSTERHYLMLARNARAIPHAHREPGMAFAIEIGDARKLLPQLLISLQRLALRETLDYLGAL